MGSRRTRADTKKDINGCGKHLKESDIKDFLSTQIIDYNGPNPYSSKHQDGNQ